MYEILVRLSQALSYGPIVVVVTSLSRWTDRRASMTLTETKYSRCVHIWRQNVSASECVITQCVDIKFDSIRRGTTGDHPFNARTEGQIGRHSSGLHHGQFLHTGCESVCYLENFAYVLYRWMIS